MRKLFSKAKAAFKFEASAELRFAATIWHPEALIYIASLHVLELAEL